MVSCLHAAAATHTIRDVCVYARTHGVHLSHSFAAVAAEHPSPLPWTNCFFDLMTAEMY